MKRFSSSRTFILAISIVLLLPFLFYSRRPEIKSIARNISLSQEPDNDRNASLPNRNAVEIGSRELPAETPVVKYNISIPGRTTRSAEFIPGKNDSISLEGTSLAVPAGCLSQRRILSITGLLAEDLPPIPAELTNVTKNYYAGYRFLPHGMLFDSTAAIAIPYDNSLIPEGYTADDVYTFYFDESDNKWKALERDSINNRLSLVISRTLHFTDMINGIIKVPESPETEGFAPTTIKDIKAADPSAGITLIAAPEANSIGDAELSYPFKLPEGREGRQPQLTLQYSSDGNADGQVLAGI
jgi:hypothetical protein